MISFLHVLAIGIIIAGVMIGLSIGSWGVLIGPLTGIIGSVFYFALAKILINQERILACLQDKHPENSPPESSGKIKCSKCEAPLESDMLSCPYCGYKKDS